MFFFVIFIHQGLRSLNELEPDYQLANQRWLIILKVAMSTVNCVIFNCRVCLQERLLQNYHPEDSIICPRSEFIPLIKMHAGPSPSRFIPRQNAFPAFDDITCHLFTTASRPDFFRHNNGIVSRTELDEKNMSKRKRRRRKLHRRPLKKYFKLCGPPAWGPLHVDIINMNNWTLHGGLFRNIYGQQKLINNEVSFTVGF